MKNFAKFIVILLVLAVSLLCLTLIGLSQHYQGKRNWTNTNSLVAGLISQREKVKNKTKAKMLNHHMPKFKNLMEHIALNKQLEKSHLDKYEKYYMKIVEYYPQMYDAYGLLGYCYTQLGDSTKALQYYEIAGERPVEYFWYDYNTGLLYLKSGQYQLALQAFNKALKQNPELTLRHILSSKIYQQILSGSAGMTYNLERELKQGYEEAHKIASLLMLYELKKVPESTVKKIATAMKFKII